MNCLIFQFLTQIVLYITVSDMKSLTLQFLTWSVLPGQKQLADEIYANWKLFARHFYKHNNPTTDFRTKQIQLYKSQKLGILDFYQSKHNMCKDLFKHSPNSIKEMIEESLQANICITINGKTLNWETWDNIGIQCT